MTRPGREPPGTQGPRLNPRELQSPAEREVRDMDRETKTGKDREIRRWKQYKENTEKKM
jgi:hypothetical protein